MQCSMLDDFHQPSVVDGIEESTDVRVEYPVLCQNSALLKNHVCNLMHRKVLVSFHQHLMAEAPMRSV